MRDWANYNFATWEGVEEWTGPLADWAGVASIAEQAIATAGVVVGGVSCPFTMGIGCAVGGAMSSYGGAVATTSGWVSTGASTLNAFANWNLGNETEALKSGASAALGWATGGLGSGYGRALFMITDDFDQAVVDIGMTAVDTASEILLGGSDG